MMPPMMHQVATERMASPSRPSRRPQRQARYTATATATKVKKPCQDSWNAAVRIMSGSNGIFMTARMSMELQFLSLLLRDVGDALLPPPIWLNGSDKVRRCTGVSQGGLHRRVFNFG